MRTTGSLAAVLALLLAPGTALADDTEAPDEPLPPAAGLSVLVGGSCSGTEGAPLSDQTRTSTCTGLPCSPVFVELDPLEPKLRPECIEEIIQDVRGLIGI